MYSLSRYNIKSDSNFELNKKKKKNTSERRRIGLKVNWLAIIFYNFFNHINADLVSIRNV